MPRTLPTFMSLFFSKARFFWRGSWVLSLVLVPELMAQEEGLEGNPPPPEELIPADLSDLPGVGDVRLDASPAPQERLLTINTPIGPLPVLVRPAGKEVRLSQKELARPPEFRPPSIFSAPLPTGSGARALGIGGSFTVIADDATAASWNPAGLLQLQRPEASAVYRFSDSEHRHRSADPNFEPRPSDRVQSDGLNYLSAVLPVYNTWLDRNMVFSINYQESYDFSQQFGARIQDRSSETLTDFRAETFVFDQVDNFSFQDGLIDVEIRSRFETLATSSLRQDITTRLDADFDFEQKGIIEAYSPSMAIELTPKWQIGATLNLHQDSGLPSRQIRSRTAANYVSRTDSRATLTHSRTTRGSYEFDGVIHIPNPLFGLEELPLPELPLPGDGGLPLPGDGGFPLPGTNAPGFPSPFPDGAGDELPPPDDETPLPDPDVEIITPGDVTVTPGVMPETTGQEGEEGGEINFDSEFFDLPIEATSGRYPSFTDTSREEIRDSLIVKGRYEEINKFENLFGWNATLGTMYAINRMFQVGASVDLAWAADAEQTKTVITESTTYDGETMQVLGTQSGRTQSTEDVTFHFPLTWQAGGVIRWTQQFYTSFDVSQTRWSDFAFESESGGKINPFDGSRFGENPVDDTWTWRAGAEYLFLFDDFVIPIRAGYIQEERPALGEPDVYHGWSVGTGLGMNVGFGRLIVDIAFSTIAADNVQSVIPSQDGLETDTTQHQAYISAVLHF